MEDIWNGYKRHMVLFSTALLEDEPICTQEEKTKILPIAPVNSG